VKHKENKLAEHTVGEETGGETGQGSPEGPIENLAGSQKISWVADETA
jgi:hypothetical protein